MMQATRYTPEEIPWGLQLSRGVGKDSNELLYTQQQSYEAFYQNSETIQDGSPQETILNIEALNNEPVFKAIAKITAELDDLKNWGTDSYGCPAPSYSTVARADDWITRLYFQAASQDWLEPNVTYGSEGEVVFEWWYGVKKLTIYVSNQDIEYIKVWGADIYEEMADGNARSLNVCRELWAWLRN